MSPDSKITGHRITDELTLPGVIGGSLGLREVIRTTRRSHHRVRVS